MAEGGDVTLLLGRWRSGDAASGDAVTRLVYAELRRLAGAYLRRERAGHTLQPTALVAEAYLRLCGGGGPDVEDRRHFVAVAARHMRQILVDHARRRRADKRGGGALQVTLDESIVAGAGASDLASLDEALAELEAIDA